MYPDRIHNAQRVLRALAGYRGSIDGDPGPLSLSAAARVPGAPGADWPPARRVIAAAQVALDRAGFGPGAWDGFWGPDTDTAFSRWRGDRLPSRPGPAGINLDRLGPAGTARCTAGVVRVPWRMFLAWDTAEAIEEIRCHELVAGSAQRALDRIAAAYTEAQLRDLGLHLFGGCYNFRPMRGGDDLSTHAYGAAMDFDPARNRLSWGADRARLAQRDATPFWHAWQAEGWVSLGRARNYDWMHVQAVPL